jgi:2-polyprenyl-3-methyl-5-hydroxy-6-metoxy-1,4-benzoquinol methylase
MKNIVEYYSRFDEWGRLDREPLEFQINWHYMCQYLPPAGRVLDNGAGPGKYAMKLAECGHSVTLTDLTPRLVESAIQKSAELGLDDRFEGFHIRNATHLEFLSEEENRGGAYGERICMG